MVMAQTGYHIPCMLDEVLEYLNLTPGKTIVDCTLGTAGHSVEIIKRIVPNGKLIGIDRDQESIEIAKDRLADYSGNFELAYGNFSEVDNILKNLNVNGIDGILFDLGISTFQLQNSQRGFSFQQEGPLDMRLDRNSYISAYDLLNNLNEQEISNILWTFGEERWHNRIARSLIREREKHPITTTAELANIVCKSIPGRFRQYHYKIHPATRTFQAIRIAVNRDLESLESVISKVIPLLNKGGRICIISFHSLEDRIVKINFKKFAAQQEIKIITPKPLTPRESEVRQNPASRSSKLRVAERI